MVLRKLMEIVLSLIILGDLVGEIFFMEGDGRKILAKRFKAEKEVYVRRIFQEEIFAPGGGG